MDRKLVSLSVSTLIGAFAAVLVLGAINGCGRRGDTLAVVNGEPISMTEFYEYLQNKPEVTVVTQNGNIALPVDGSLGFQAARDLIGHQVELQIAKDKGCYPSESRVEQELQTQLKQNPNYLLGLMQKGLTIDVIRKSITLDLAQECLQTQGVTVTSEDAKKYIKKNPKLFMDPERVLLSLIYVKNAADKAKVDEALGSGQEFNSVAQALSQAPTAKRLNGHFTNPDDGPVATSALPQPIQQAIAGLGDHESSEWLQFSNGYAKLAVDKRTPAKPIVMDDAKIELVRREMAKRKGEQKNNIQEMVLEKLKTAKVDVVQTAYQDTWKQAVQQLKTE